MDKSSTLLDIRSLPANARQEIRDFYEFLKKRYAHEEERSEFTPENYRGVIDIPSEEIESRLRKLRDEWDRELG